jgi:hypothetical protein
MEFAIPCERVIARVRADDSYQTKNADPVGRTNMKLLILSDIHGNWPALQSIINAESDADQILCLGDLVDYGPEPAACVAWAMRTQQIPLYPR